MGSLKESLIGVYEGLSRQCAESTVLVWLDQFWPLFTPNCPNTGLFPPDYPDIVSDCCKPTTLALVVNDPVKI